MKIRGTNRFFTMSNTCGAINDEITFKYFKIHYLGTKEELIRTVLNGTEDPLEYSTGLQYQCKDKRKYLKYGTTSTPVASRTYVCYWKKVFEV